MLISSKPHHALCIILFSEEGHSSPYISIMREHIEQLRNDPETEVILCSDLDAICGFCPHNDNSICEKANEVDVSDSTILSYCGLTFGSRLSWDDLRRKLIDNIVSKDLLKDACKGCVYLPRCEKMTTRPLF